MALDAVFLFRVFSFRFPVVLVPGHAPLLHARRLVAAGAAEREHPVLSVGRSAHQIGYDPFPASDFFFPVRVYARAHPAAAAGPEHLAFFLFGFGCALHSQVLRHLTEY